MERWDEREPKNLSDRETLHHPRTESRPQLLLFTPFLDLKNDAGNLQTRTNELFCCHKLKLVLLSFLLFHICELSNKKKKKTSMIHKCLMAPEVSLQPAQPGLFISTHHVWLPEHHSCPKYPTCLKTVAITSSARAHSIIPEAENNNPQHASAASIV